MWMMPLHLHVNQNSDYDDDDENSVYSDEMFHFHMYKHVAGSETNSLHAR